MNARKKLATALAILFLLSFLIYSGFEAEKLIYGPQIILSSPKNNDTLQGSGLIKVTGSTKNVSFISLDGRQIFTDTNGNFNESLVLLPGYNIITLSAKGRYGKEVSRKLQLYFVKDSVNTFVATSSATTTEIISTTTATSTINASTTPANFSPKNLKGHAKKL